TVAEAFRGVGNGAILGRPRGQNRAAPLPTPDDLATRFCPPSYGAPCQAPPSARAYGVTDERRSAHPSVAGRADRSEALIAWRAHFFERNEGVKGGFAAA